MALDELRYRVELALVSALMLGMFIAAWIVARAINAWLALTRK